MHNVQGPQKSAESKYYTRTKLETNVDTRDLSVC